jgi:uncharacterized membrane protein YvlD (DUF360 family)
MLGHMSPLVALLIKLGIRLVVFTGVFWLAAKKNKDIVFEKKWAPPLVGLLFAVLNTGLYWMIKPLLKIATFGAATFALPFVINGVLLYATMKAFEKKKWFRIQGFFAPIWMALFLTAAHGVLWLAVDYIPAHV